MVLNQKQYLSHPLIQKDLILRRKYQESIFVNCLDNNSLVIIPTGLGKTIIALMLAVHRLTELPDSKIIFLAPTKPLVNQHYESFLKLTAIESTSLKSITGTISPSERKEIWENIKIAFMTPQVLQNDIISNHYSLENVSLIIFDECHRAVGDYAYCFIAKKFINISKDPQILGLTASPGSTEEKINEIKENLFIEHMEIRTEKDSDVKPYIYKVDQYWIKVELPEEFSGILKILSEKLKNIYKCLKTRELINSIDINKVSRKDLLNLNKEINNRIASVYDENEKYQLFKAKKLQANAIRISHMIELLETQGINALKEYFEKNLEKIKRNTANKSLKELFGDKDMKKVLNLTNKIHSEGIIHPKIENLKEILHKQLIENSESRVLVFCHFRDSVNNIINIFDDDEIIRAHKFIGQANKVRDKGLTQKQQIKILKEFREGIYNTLIGTSVAEEGLDIAECDLVVFYDVVPSAIRSIQRRGRTGRKKEGKVYILMAKGTRDEGYYWAEKRKERNMYESLKKIKKAEVTSNQKEQKSLLNFISEISENEKSKINALNNGENKLESSKERIHKMEGAENYTIICDNRETASPVVRKLSLMGVNLKLEQLEVADYVISERAGIERKSSQDFNESLKDGRLFKELLSLKKNYSRAILILEGDPFQNSTINENALYGAITSIILKLGITIYKTKDVNETSYFLYHLAKKEQTEKKIPNKLRFKKAPFEMSYLLEFIVSSIPGINTLRAKSLLEEMKSIQKIFNADIGDLMTVKNIGKKIAQEIYKISRFKYSNE
ncbi:MAG: DEAD/DEAH box helicase family protein [Candidatus Lokiarchaeota archaeon]|nr:DEAD/DEAH box helicase family protein [Candidatus Lokiarchaeota archaeon]